MRTYLQQSQGRTIRDDAPPYNPAIWEHDTSYVTRIADQIRSQQRQEQQQQMRNGVHLSSSVLPMDTSLSSGRYAGFHTLPLRQPTNMISRLIKYLFPAYYLRSQSNLSAEALSKLTPEELLTLMQMALAAGEKERSALIAKELSIRRVSVAFEPRGANDASVAPPQQHQAAAPVVGPPPPVMAASTNGRRSNDIYATPAAARNVSQLYNQPVYGNNINNSNHYSDNNASNFGRNMAYSAPGNNWM